MSEFHFGDVYKWDKHKDVVIPMETLERGDCFFVESGRDRTGDKRRQTMRADYRKYGHIDCSEATLRALIDRRDVETIKKLLVIDKPEQEKSQLERDGWTLFDPDDRVTWPRDCQPVRVLLDGGVLFLDQYSDVDLCSWIRECGFNVKVGLAPMQIVAWKMEENDDDADDDDE
jgi:hypothetical protein